MRLRAIQEGYYKGVIPEGKVFDFPDDRECPSWAVGLDGKKPAAKKPAAKKPAAKKTGKTADSEDPEDKEGAEGAEGTEGAGDEENK